MALPQTLEAMRNRRVAREYLMRLGYTQTSIKATDSLIDAQAREYGVVVDHNDPQKSIDAWAAAFAPEPDTPAQEPLIAAPAYKGEIVPPRERNLLRGVYKPSSAWSDNVARARAAQPRVVAMASNVRDRRID